MLLDYNIAIKNEWSVLKKEKKNARIQKLWAEFSKVN